MPPGFPPELVGAQIVILAGVYAGPVDEGERVTQPLRELATPLLDLSDAEPFVEIQSAFDPFFPKGLLQYWKSLNVDALSDELIDELCRLAAERPSPRSTWTSGTTGAADAPRGRRRHGLRPPVAVPGRLRGDLGGRRPTPSATSPGPRPGGTSLRRFSADGGIYLNFPGDGEGGESLVRAAYGDANYERLAALKATYDPTNLFRMNLNIAPAARALIGDGGER